MSHTRIAQVRAGSTKTPGHFEAVLFTSGEASDGHILDIDGASLPERMPMFVNHFPDPTEQVGTFYPRREGDVIVVRGEILMEGEGAAADIRRDLDAKIRAGHVGSVSGRWDVNADDADAVVARTSLPKSHPAHVPSDARGVKRHGQLFKRWRAVEGSIVGLGADPAAVMRFATDLDRPQHVRAFWAEQMRHALSPDTEPIAAQIAATIRDELSDVLVPIVQRLEALETSTPTDTPAREDASREDHATQDRAGHFEAVIVQPGELAAIVAEEQQRMRAEFAATLAKLRGEV